LPHIAEHVRHKGKRLFLPPALHILSHCGTHPCTPRSKPAAHRPSYVHASHMQHTGVSGRREQARGHRAFQRGRPAPLHRCGTASAVGSSSPRIEAGLGLSAASDGQVGRQQRVVAGRQRLRQPVLPHGLRARPAPADRPAGSSARAARAVAVHGPPPSAAPARHRQRSRHTARWPGRACACWAGALPAR